MIKFKNWKKIAFPLFLLTTHSFAVQFEQNGVKDGNIKLSLGLYSTHNDKENADNYTLDTQVGYFVNDSLELYLGLKTDTANDDTMFVLSPGINYYFYKTPTVTPYIGFQYYYQNTTNEFIEALEGNTLYIGTHVFLNENVAVTPEFGINYMDFTEQQNTYFNTFLSYFF
jgi:hypothetical protein